MLKDMVFAESDKVLQKPTALFVSTSPVFSLSFFIFSSTEIIAETQVCRPAFPAKLSPWVKRSIWFKPKEHGVEDIAYSCAESSIAVKNV